MDALSLIPDNKFQVLFSICISKYIPYIYVGSPLIRVKLTDLSKDDKIRHILAFLNGREVSGQAPYPMNKYDYWYNVQTDSWIPIGRRREFDWNPVCTDTIARRRGAAKVCIQLLRLDDQKKAWFISKLVKFDKILAQRPHYILRQYLFIPEHCDMTRWLVRLI